MRVEKRRLLVIITVVLGVFLCSFIAAYAHVDGWVPTEGVEYTIEGNFNEYGVSNVPIVLNVAEGYQIAFNSLPEEGDGFDRWEDSGRTFDSLDSAGEPVVFYLKEIATGAVSEKVSVNMYFDNAAPSINAFLGEWRYAQNTNQYIEDFEYSTYFTEDTVLRVEIFDEGDSPTPGLVSLAYYESERGMPLEELKKLGESYWTEITKKDENSFYTELEAIDGKQAIYYVRAIDKGGNVAYASSEAAKFDLSAPQITGVEDGGVYFTTQNVVAEGGYIVFGKAEEYVQGIMYATKGDTWLLEGNPEVETEYILFARDSANNKTDKIRITMKPISSLADPILNLTENNVKAEDEEVILSVKKAVEEIDTTNATGEEIEALNEIVEKCETLLAVIDDVEINEDSENIEDIKENEGSEEKLGMNVPESHEEKTEVEEKTASAVPGTGDDSNLGLWCIISVVSVLAAVLTAFKGRKQ